MVFTPSLIVIGHLSDLVDFVIHSIDCTNFCDLVDMQCSDKLMHIIIRNVFTVQYHS